MEFRIWNLGFWILSLLVSCSSKEKHEAETEEYTCPMHPQVIQEKPGTCPICGMELVRKRNSGKDVAITSEMNYLLQPTNASVLSTIKVTSPVQKSLEIAYETKGVITYDTRRITNIPVRVGGRIEKLFIRYNFQPIRKGQKILEVYSPELITAQRELLYLIRSDENNTALIEGGKQKLSLLGMSENQIKDLISTKQESGTFAMHSPYDGYILEEAVLSTSTPGQSSSAPEGMGGKMNKVPASTPVQSELSIREGMYVQAGQTIFKVVNTSQVWAEFNLAQHDAANIKINDKVSIRFDNTDNEMLDAKINFIQPFFKDGENFSKVRVYVSNLNDHYRVGQLVTASIQTLTDSMFWIPVSARQSLGTKDVVFIKDGSVFKPKEIKTGRQSGEWIEIVEGLKSNDSIADNAQFMVDSESFIKVEN